MPDVAVPHIGVGVFHCASLCFTRGMESECWCLFSTEARRACPFVVIKGMKDAFA